MKDRLLILLTVLLLGICDIGYSQGNVYQTSLLTYGSIPQLDQPDTSYKILVNSADATGYSDS